MMASTRLLLALCATLAVARVAHAQDDDVPDNEFEDELDVDESDGLVRNCITHDPDPQERK